MTDSLNSKSVHPCRIGRKKCFATFTTLVVCTMFTVVVLDTTGTLTAIPALVTFLSLLGKGAVVMVWRTATLITMEVYPTLVR